MRSANVRFCNLALVERTPRRHRADAPFLSMRFVSHSARHLAAASLSSIFHLSNSVAIAFSVAESLLFYQLGSSLSTGLAALDPPSDLSCIASGLAKGLNCTDFRA